MKDEKKYINVMEEFVAFLQQYEGVKIPDLDAFNQGMIAYQERLKECKMLSIEERKQMCEYMISHWKNFQELLQIYILSALAYFLDGGEYVGELLRLVRKSDFLLEENKFFIYQQINTYSFRIKGYCGKEESWERRMLYRDIYRGYQKRLGICKQVVPEEKRNSQKIVFFINQFLNESHGPTKTVLDRCEVMADRMGAECVIINTAELRATAGYIPFFAPEFGNYSTLLSEMGMIEYKGKKFPFLQCSDNMPNIDEIAKVIELVKQINPYCLFLVGGGSVCADLCSNFYPLITVGTVPSGLMTTEGQFLLKGKSITEEDVSYIKRLGFSENYLQYCLFTSAINPQIGVVTRQQYGIPKDAFTILIVGSRLDFEVTDEFVEQVLLPVMQQGIVSVFMGVFDDYSKRCQKYPTLGDSSVFVGFVKDVQAVNEICDVYVNPRRNGGGTSVVEAMAKKLPPVTLNYGDVALGAGEDFWVEDYDDMVQQILRLQDDEVFYQTMSEKAYERMKVVTDTSTVFWNTFEIIRRLPEFQ